MALITKSGHDLHPIGIGTWGIASRVNSSLPSGRYRDVEAVRGREDEEIDAIRHSISLGQNHLDCAELYGAFYTDEVVGAAIAGAGAARSDLFIGDKLWRHSTAPGAVRATVEQMLTKLRTDYLDLLSIHAPWKDVEWQAALPQIDRLIDEGIVRHLGVSNFTITHMREAQAIAMHPIRANQVHFNCLHRDEADDAFRSFCDEHSIAIVAYQPMKRGAVLGHPALVDIATDHGATPAQVALAWLVHLGALAIPKATQRSHIEENLAALDIELTTSDLDVIATLSPTDHPSSSSEAQ